MRGIRIKIDGNKGIINGRNNGNYGDEYRGRRESFVPLGLVASRRIRTFLPMKEAFNGTGEVEACISRRYLLGYVSFLRA